MQSLQFSTRNAIMDIYLDVRAYVADVFDGTPRRCVTRLERGRCLYPLLRQRPHHPVPPMGTLRRPPQNPRHDPHNHPHQFPRRTKCHSRRNDRVAAAMASRSSTSPTKTACPSRPTKSQAAASPASASNYPYPSHNPLTAAPTRPSLAGAAHYVLWHYVIMSCYVSRLIRLQCQNFFVIL